MDKNVMELWVKALRSGKYKQGHTTLCFMDRYCCLGVLAEEMGAFDDQLSVSTGRKVCFGDTAILEGWIKAGACPLRDPFGKPTKGGDSLVTMNDEGKTFEEIADYIEENADLL